MKYYRHLGKKSGTTGLRNLTIDELPAVLDQVSEPERHFLLDLLNVSAAFDGQLSRLERHPLPEAFKDLKDVYMQRTIQLKTMLVSGQLHAAKALCTLDLKPG